MSEQADFWKDSFGDEYITRNDSDLILSANLSFFSEVVSAMGSRPASVFELGTNLGMNRDALKLLCPKAVLGGV